MHISSEDSILVQNINDIVRVRAEIALSVIPGLLERSAQYPDTFHSAALEIMAALKGRCFNNYLPQDPELWELIAGPVRRSIDYDDARICLLPTLLRPIMEIVISSAEFTCEAVMIDKRIPVFA
jgi:hypothetical protein